MTEKEIKKIRKLISKYIKYYVKGGIVTAPIITLNNEVYIKSSYRNDGYNQVDFSVGYPREYEFTLYNLKLNELGISLSIDDLKKIFSFIYSGKITFIECDIPLLGINPTSVDIKGQPDYIYLAPKSIADNNDIMVSELAIYNSNKDEIVNPVNYYIDDSFGIRK